MPSPQNASGASAGGSRTPIVAPVAGLPPWSASGPRSGRLLKSVDAITIVDAAQALPEGGWYTIPRCYADGALIVGDAAGFMNSMRLKGIHLAMRSGMLAAETIFAAGTDHSRNPIPTPNCHVTRFSFTVVLSPRIGSTE